MQVVLNFYGWLTSIPASTWYAVGVFVMSSAFVSAIVEVIKRKFWKAKQRDMTKKAVAAIMALFGFAFTAATYVISTAQQHPSFLGTHTLQIVGFAYIIYHFGLSSTYAKIAATLAKINAIASAYNADMAAAKAAAQPAPVVAPVDPIPAATDPASLLG